MSSHYLYKLIPPWPTFAADMTEAEASVMRRHITYWTGLRDEGTAVAFGPVADPAGSWGVAIAEAANEQDAADLRAADPAVSSGMATMELYPMPRAVVRPPT